MRISDWSSDVCSSDLDFLDGDTQLVIHNAAYDVGFLRDECNLIDHIWPEYPIIDTLKEAAKKFPGARHSLDALRSEEHTSELQSLMRISYAVFCLKKKTTNHNNIPTTTYTKTTHI